MCHQRVNARKMNKTHASNASVINRPGGLPCALQKLTNERACGHSAILNIFKSSAIGRNSPAASQFALKLFMFQSPGAALIPLIYKLNSAFAITFNVIQTSKLNENKNIHFENEIILYYLKCDSIPFVICLLNCMNKLNFLNARAGTH